MSGLRYILVAAVSVVAATFSGCASYVTPGGAVDLSIIESDDIAAVMARKPAATFPANIALVRVQPWNYEADRNDIYGKGEFAVITSRDMFDDDDFDVIEAWQAVRDVAPMSRMLLPRQLRSVADLRTAAAKVRADMLLVFTVDTSFRVNGRAIGPLSVISLGTFRDRETVVTSVASALLVDVRTGFIYGVAEASASEQKETSAWGSQRVIDESRLVTEREACDHLLSELAATWSGVVAEHNDAQAGYRGHN